MERPLSGCRLSPDNEGTRRQLRFPPRCLEKTRQPPRSPIAQHGTTSLEDARSASCEGRRIEKSRQARSLVNTLGHKAWSSSEAGNPDDHCGSVEPLPQMQFSNR